MENRIYTHQGVRVLGLGGSMRYKEEGEHQYSQRQMRLRVGRLSLQLYRNKGFDILLTHSPALGLGDDTDLAHRGFEIFLQLIDKYRPRVMAHGHVHQSYRFDFKRERKHGDTLVINACGCYVLDLDV